MTVWYIISKTHKYILLYLEPSTYTITSLHFQCWPKREKNFFSKIENLIWLLAGGNWPPLDSFLFHWLTSWQTLYPISSFFFCLETTLINILNWLLDEFLRLLSFFCLTNAVHFLKRLLFMGLKTDFYRKVFECLLAGGLITSEVNNGLIFWFYVYIYWNHVKL